MKRKLTIEEENNLPQDHLQDVMEADKREIAYKIEQIEQFVLGDEAFMEVAEEEAESAEEEMVDKVGEQFELNQDVIEGSDDDERSVASSSSEVVYDFREQHITDQDLDSICASFEAHGVKGAFFVDCTFSSAKKLTERLLKYNRLERLYLDHGMIGGEEHHLAEVIRANPILEDLRVEHCGLTDKDAIQIAEALANNTTLTSLRLTHNNITDKGARELFRAIATHNKIMKFCLSENNIGDGATKELAHMIEHNHSLKSLNLIQTNLTAESLKILAPVLKANRNIDSLGLGDNIFGVEGAAILAEILQTNTTLEDLDLSASLTDMGMEVFSQGLRQNKGLRHIKLYDSPITAAGVKTITEALTNHPSLRFLRLSMNINGNVFFDTESMRHFINFVRQDRSFLHINLGPYVVAQQDVMIVYAHGLQIDVDRNIDVVVKDFIEAMKANWNLEDLRSLINQVPSSIKLKNRMSPYQGEDDLQSVGVPILEINNDFSSKAISEIRERMEGNMPFSYKLFRQFLLSKTSICNYLEPEEISWAEDKDKEFKDNFFELTGISKVQPISKEGRLIVNKIAGFIRDNDAVNYRMKIIKEREDCLQGIPFKMTL